jgi:rhodanese-related sulfurtransferase
VWVIVIALGLTMSFALVMRKPVTWKALISARFPGIQWVDSETLSQWMDSPSDEELVLLDVRSPEEQKVSQLRGAQCVDAKQPDLDSLAIPEDAKVVVYCSIGYRSAALMEDLKRAGVEHVYNLEGGLFDWANQGRPIYRGEERVEKVHPFNRIWGLLLSPDLRAESH